MSAHRRAASRVLHVLGVHEPPRVPPGSMWGQGFLDEREQPHELGSTVRGQVRPDAVLITCGRALEIGRRPSEAIDAPTRCASGLSTAWPAARAVETERLVARLAAGPSVAQALKSLMRESFGRACAAGSRPRASWRAPQQVTFARPSPAFLEKVPAALLWQVIAEGGLDVSRDE